VFIGHFGVGFAGKRAAPRTSLGTLFLSAQFIDLLWPTLVLAGVERVEIRPGVTRVTPLDFVSYPISHSLALVVCWGVLFGVVYWLVQRYRAGALIVGAAVISHWFLDAIVHRPDLPLAPGLATRVGLGLWNSLPATLAIEGITFGAGLALYLRTTSPLDRIGQYGTMAFALLLVGIYAANVWGPPPPSVRAIGWAGQAQWLLVFLGYWIDRHRRRSHR
jgi:FtsH-binding integral membrane protein